MSTPQPSRPALSPAALIFLGAIFLAPACTTPHASTSATASASAPSTASSVASLDALTYDGSQRAVASLDRAIAAAGKDSEKLAALSARLITVLRDPAATFAGRQAAGQRLSLFPADTLLSGENSALFVAMLADDKQVALARLALDRVPGEAVDALYLDALRKIASPAARLALVQSVNKRQIATAVPLLIPLLADSDSNLAAAATKALGVIGTPEAAAALRTAPNPNSTPIVEARLAAAYRLSDANAARVFQEIFQDLAAPANLRAAALHGLLFAEPATAPAWFVATLSGDDRVAKPVVIEAIATHPSKDLVPALTAPLASWDAPTQTAVIAALGRRGDSAAVPALSTATKHADADVRAAAIVALGQIPGSPETARLLAGLAVGSDAADSKLARQSLAQLNGPDVADAVLDGAAHAETPVRIVFLEELAARNMTAAVPLLLQTRADPSVSIRTAALGSLAELAPASEQRPILDWAIAATEPAEQSRALRALASVSLRDPDIAQRARPVIAAIEQAPSAVALRLLPVLPRLGGTTTAEATAQLARRDDPSISDAATAVLSRWTDRAGLLPLLVVAEKAPRESVRAAAVRGEISYLQRSRDLPTTELRTMVARLIAASHDDTARGQLVYLLGRCTDSESLALAEKLKAEPALARDAADAVLAIRSNRTGLPVLTASANPDALKNIFDGKRTTNWGVQALATQWLQFDFKSPRPFREIVIDNGGSVYNYPEYLEIFVTDNPQKPGQAKASLAGHAGKTVIDLPAVARGRYLIIRHTKERADSWWTVAGVEID